MFYAHFVLAKKGPLARIWLAAHWDKKLTKAHVFETSIEKSVEGILHPKVKMALRTSGHLLLGVVRIYSRKAKYLLADCNEAFVKIKMAFRPGVVDLPEESREAAIQAITLPEVFHDFDSCVELGGGGSGGVGGGGGLLGDMSDITTQLSLNQSRAEEITLREDYGSLSLHDQEPGDDNGDAIGDGGFGDLDFAGSPPEPEFIRGLVGSTPSFGRSSGGLFEQSLEVVRRSGGAGAAEDAFGGAGGEMAMEAAGLFEGGSLFDDPPAAPSPGPASSPTSPGGPPSPDFYSDGAASPLPPELDQQEKLVGAGGANGGPGEESSFALAPIEALQQKATATTPTSSKQKRKRKLIVDELKNISGEIMKQQLSDTTDILTTLDLAPPTKRLMYWKETGGVEKLFVLAGRQLACKTIGKLYQVNLTSQPVDEIEAATQVQVQVPAAMPTLSAVKKPARGSKRKASEEVAPPVLRRESGAAIEAMSTLEQMVPPAPPVTNTTFNATFDQTTDLTSTLNMSMMENLGYDGSLETTVQPQQQEQTNYYDYYDNLLSLPDQNQQDEETLEEFEERVVNRRAVQMFKLIECRLVGGGENGGAGAGEALQQLNFNKAICHQQNTRKQIAQKFYTVLVLKKLEAVELEQAGPGDGSGFYGDILLSRGRKFGQVGL